MQNESEVGSDMLLVSGNCYTLNIMSIEFETDTCEPLQYLGLHVYQIYVMSIMNSTWDKMPVKTFTYIKMK